MITRKQTIYVSHSGTPRDENYLRELESKLSDKAKIIKGNYEKAREHNVLNTIDFVLFFITKNYPYSEKCMLEAVRLSESSAWAYMQKNELESYKRVIFILFDEENETKTVSSNSINDIVRYWEREHGRLHMNNDTGERYENISKFKSKTKDFFKSISNGIHPDFAYDYLRNLIENASMSFKMHWENIYEACDCIDMLENPILTEEQKDKYPCSFEDLYIKIDNLEEKLKKEYEEKLKGKEVKPLKQTRVCVIYTGGTAGDVYTDPGNTNSPTRQATLTELMQWLPNIRTTDYHVHYYSFKEAIDSSNASSVHWVSIARVIENLHDKYSGFVIIHGSNTMVYSASALSFLLKGLNKPVIFTGAELPLGNPQTDAVTNVERSIDIVAEADQRERDRKYCDEVCIFYGHDLIRGNRAVKHGALDTSKGFYSPNFSALAISRGQVFFFNVSRKKDRTFKFEASTEISHANNIYILDIFPNLNLDIINKLDDDREGTGKALILRSYAIGGIPSGDDFLKPLKTFRKNKGIIINIAQNDAGPERSEIFMMREHYRLTDVGVVHGGDMVTGATFCKLKYLFALHNNLLTEEYGNENDRYEIFRTSVETDMLIDFRGELSKSSYLAKSKENFDDDNDFKMAVEDLEKSIVTGKVKKIIKGDNLTPIECKFFDSSTYPFHSNEKNTVIESLSIRIEHVKLLDGFKENERFLIDIYLSDEENANVAAKYEIILKNDKLLPINDLTINDNNIIIRGIVADSDILGNNYNVAKIKGTTIISPNGIVPDRFVSEELTIYIKSTSHTFVYSNLTVTIHPCIAEFD